MCLGIGIRMWSLGLFINSVFGSSNFSFLLLCFDPIFFYDHFKKESEIN
jgi:hypothetical protein